jgi:hypothetical protein
MYTKNPNIIEKLLNTSEIVNFSFIKIQKALLINLIYEKIIILELLLISVSIE